MFNRSEILRAAWAEYRATSELVGRTVFKRSAFARALRSAWKSAQIAAYARREYVAALAEVEAAKSNPALARTSEIQNELRVMEYSDARTDWTRHADLRAELATQL